MHLLLTNRNHNISLALAIWRYYFWTKRMHNP